MDNTNCILYADDTNIFVVGKTKEEAFSRANKVLENVHAYMKYNLLHINMEKFCFMNFQPKAFSESENCSRTVLFVGNNHVSKAIYINSQKLKSKYVIQKFWESFLITSLTGLAISMN